MSDYNFFNDFEKGDVFWLNEQPAAFNRTDADCVLVELEDGEEVWLCWNEDDGKFQNEANGNLVEVAAWQ